ncbi:cupin domain-containing protein [Enterobacter roggenkampii]|uniref:cupin domain-containing protein n=1 Tax=Enterobacter roggenkampii TaxID=1812935 RepID=UPI002DBE4E96|nr:cupin domain-containing protein [Enterobacter roggenkampii]MEB5887478.1 cupin domain-containing protein [Enterobacter roggenkampii]
MIKLRLVTTLLFGGMLLMTSNISNAQQAAKVTSESLMQTGTSWDGSSYISYPQGKPELSILKITVPAHTTLGWHTHPVPNAAYVLSGHLTVEKQSDGSKKTIHAGETLAETVGTVHRGFTEDEPVTLIVFYAGANGHPLSEASK